MTGAHVAMREPDEHFDGLNYAQLKNMYGQEKCSNAESRQLRLERDKGFYYFVESAAL